MFELEPVVPTEKQTEELYRQLCARVHKISHAERPAYEKHKEFVSNHPYRAWFIVKQENIVLGNVYIQYDNSIGFNCRDQITETQIKSILDLVSNKLRPLDPVPSVRVGKFFLNVAVSNIDLQNKLKNLGLKESQRSFIFEP
ncbi:MAG: hypothetical protein ABJF60_18720 [Roseobacter sp.]